MKAIVALVGLLFGAVDGGAQLSSGMEPISAYLMDRDHEISLAQSAARSSIASGASVLILTEQGYEEALVGSNGFTCLVERSWGTPFRNSNGYWLPALIVPTCFNEKAAGSALVEYLRRTDLALAGRTLSQTERTVLMEIGTGDIPVPPPGAIAYRLSESQWLGDDLGRWRPHVVVYAPYATDADWGSNDVSSGLPLMFDFGGGPMAHFVVPVDSWRHP